MPNWSDVFKVLERYGMGIYDIYAEHDVIFIMVPVASIDVPDWAALQEFGFSETDEGYMEKYV
jgi:hypothetical protein